MDVKHVEVDRDHARELYDKYRKHGGKEPQDIEAQNAFYQLSQGRTVIRALESIRLAGVDELHRSKLAIAKASAAGCWLYMSSDGSARMQAQRTVDGRARSMLVKFAPDTFPRGKHVDAFAPMPSIPPDVRPERERLGEYHVLWEAVWEKQPPEDPYLLRRIGRADLWVVLAAWELTDVEKAVLATRINGTA
jgi:hypothetical protein